MEIGRWLTNTVERYRGHNPEEIKRLLIDDNQRANPQVLRLCLTPGGTIFYKCGPVISALEVSKKQIPNAEQILGNIRIVGYTPFFIVAGLVGEDGSNVYCERPGPGYIGGELRFLDEPQQTRDLRGEMQKFIGASLSAPGGSSFVFTARLVRTLKRSVLPNFFL